VLGYKRKFKSVTISRHAKELHDNRYWKRLLALTLEVQKHKQADAECCEPTLQRHI
jgi:hypothetical protein